MGLQTVRHGNQSLIATETGGVVSLLDGNGTERLMQPYASPGEWSAAIRTIMADRKGYALMSDATFERSRAQLSWDAWATRMIADARAALTPERVARLA